MKVYTLKYENTCEVCWEKLPAGTQAYLGRLRSGGWLAVCASHETPERSILLARAARVARAVARASEVIAQAHQAWAERKERGELALLPRWAEMGRQDQLLQDAAALEELVHLANTRQVDEGVLDRVLDRLAAIASRWAETLRLAAADGYRPAEAETGA